MAQKEIRPRIVGIPWDPLGELKINRKVEIEIQKSIKTQDDFKEPPRADLEGFGMAGSLKNHQKMTPKRSSRVNKLILGKVHISSVFPMREELRYLKNT